jgi:6-phosphogluconolactonase (cycloisomerase 2 family)
VYVANDRAGTVSAFHIDAATGALTPLTAAAATDKNPYSQ